MSLMEYVSGKKYLMLHHRSSCLAENKKAVFNQNFFVRSIWFDHDLGLISF